MNERWKPIDGYFGFYEVSTLGRVRSVDRFVDRLVDGKVFRIQCRSKILKTFTTKRNGKDGYERIKLHKDSKAIGIFVHTLVASAFIPNPENLPEIDHVDTNKKNNRVDNLEWVSRLENRTRAIKCGKFVTKLNHEMASAIRSMAKTATFCELAEKFCVSIGTISNVVNRKAWKTNPELGTTGSRKRR